MNYFVALLIFVVVYVVSKVFIEKVESLKNIAEVLALVIGAVAALIYIGAIQI